MGLREDTQELTLGTLMNFAKGMKMDKHTIVDVDLDGEKLVVIGIFSMSGRLLLKAKKE